jgi:large subunit ribosomal protein L6
LSRIGKLPVKIPQGVEVSVTGRQIEVKGSKGSLARELPIEIVVDVKENEVHVSPKEDSKENKNVKALWGLYRVLVNNMVTGVSQGYKRELEIVGVGYKAELKGRDLAVSVGFASPKPYKAPDGITFTLDSPNKITIQGIDKQKVGQVAADIRRIRPPEPYKGKGIRYLGEQIRRKVGKAAGK